MRREQGITSLAKGEKMKKNKIRVLIEIPTKWIDTKSIVPMAYFGESMAKAIQSLVEEKLTDRMLAKIEMPKIKVNKKEVKEKMLEILAERALEE